MSPNIHWFRQDLRIEDNAALVAALKRPGGVIPLYILDNESVIDWRLGGASKWWLHYALKDLESRLLEKGLKLIIKIGSAEAVLTALLKETDAHTITWNRCYEPEAVKRDTHLKAYLKQLGIEVLSFNGSLLYEPCLLKNQSGKPFQVFTPFWRHCQKLPIGDVCHSWEGPWNAPKIWPKTRSIDDLKLLPQKDWDKGFYEAWEPTRASGIRQLSEFINYHLADYGEGRDIPSLHGTSFMSPYLHFGQISPREIMLAVKKAKTNLTAVDKFCSELGWREFAYHLLWHFPKTPKEPLRSEYSNFGWEKNDLLVDSWKKGNTGIPIVDAGMRQLWKTGWMHNRVRMIVASFLVKHLLQPWQVGAEWFWDTLVDADLASNTLGWQWSAGCGADAAPYFRVFNPVLQGKKFDPEGLYVRKYVPELAHVPSRWLHEPWAAPLDELGRSFVLGKHYPCPLILPEEGRKRALDVYQKWTLANRKNPVES